MIGRCMYFLTLCVLCGATMAAEISAEPKVEKPLLAHWTFNEPAGADVLTDAAASPGANVTAKGIALVGGVHGNSLDLRGEHRLQVNLGERLAGISKISFSAWTQPTDLGSYREIFRQESGHRTLFSYQDNGTTLALGLDVGGYVECDGAITPAAVLDGDWHHCAATFDGRTMRVYLDGRQIAAMDRPGKLVTQTDVPGFIASLGGSSEYFQGGLDDLRIYSDALSAEEIAALHRAGRDALEKSQPELYEFLRKNYVKHDSFAETLVSLRKTLAAAPPALDSRIGKAAVMRLNTDFPQEAQYFARITGAGALEYLRDRDGSFLSGRAARMIDLMTEYKPLTPGQWARLKPEEVARWREVEAIEKTYLRLQADGEASRYSPEWITVMLAAANYIQERPYEREAVAPYVKPSTPETRSLTEQEASDVQKRDWLYQADGNPTPQRIAQEIGWARGLAKRLSAQTPSLDFSAELARLQELEKQAASLAQADAAVYFEVRKVKRAIALRNPAVDFKKIIFVDMPYPQGSEWQHETRHRLGYMAVPGGCLLVLDGLSPQGKLMQLMPQSPLHGSFWRPDVSYDGTRIVFSFKPHNEKSFHLYEIGADGSGLTQITDGRFDDFDPIYLPDDRHVVFSTTRGHSYVRCMPPTNAYVLARCDRDGKNMYFISSNNEPDYLPSVMNDGRLIYTRWEYTDKPVWRMQKLWTMNPDGTQNSTFWGNQSVWPDLMKDARAIPGSRRVMFTGSAHHNWFSGSVGMIDPDRGLNFPNGLTKVTADVAWPETGNGPVDPVESAEYHRSGIFPAYYSPYPLGEQDFLVSAERQGKFLLYLMDVQGNRELVYEGANNIFHAIPLKPRAKPPVLTDRVVWPTREAAQEPAEGVIFSASVYDGAPPELRGKAKYLRIFHIDPKTYTYWNQRPYVSTGPVVSIVQSEGVKRLLGTVPIEADGSVAFRAPAGKALHFQLLDENQRALQTMRSFVGVMPGEQRGCLGCHESHSRAPSFEGKGLALTKATAAITPPPWKDVTVSYPRYVQPVLDQYCAKCHEGQGEGVKSVDLTPRPGFLGFVEPYFLLTGRPAWGQPYVKPENPPPGFGIADTLIVEGYGQTDPHAYQTTKPMTALSYKSRLIDLASSGKHYDVKVDPVSLLRLITWVDAMCPYRGDEEIREIPDPEFQGVDWLSIRPRIRTAPQIDRSLPVE